MPIKIPNQLPAQKILETENIFVMSEARAVSQDIRPLRILLLNLMPTKIDTETQFLRLLGNTPLQVEVDLLQTATHVANKSGRQFYLTGHPEYDRMTLANEYFRDCNRGLSPKIPYHYFPGDNPSSTPRMNWRSHANLLFSNWLNYYVYQQTPYDLHTLSSLRGNI